VSSDPDTPETATPTKSVETPAPDLDSRQRRHLRSLAHSLKPIVSVGEAGISPAVAKALDEALGTHELVKVRLRSPGDKKAAARELAEVSASALCGIVGHTVVLYRRHPNEPKIELAKHG
jgi:RNA-binding protein